VTVSVSSDGAGPTRTTGTDTLLLTRTTGTDTVFTRKGGNMGLKETIKKDLDSLGLDELLIISEQIRLLRRDKKTRVKVLPLEAIWKMTASSKSNWADDVIRERQERG
jgi:hypothetical protein